MQTKIPNKSFPFQNEQTLTPTSFFVTEIYCHFHQDFCKKAEKQMIAIATIRARSKNSLLADYDGDGRNIEIHTPSNGLLVIADFLKVTSLMTSQPMIVM